MTTNQLQHKIRMRRSKAGKGSGGNKGSKGSGGNKGSKGSRPGVGPASLAETRETVAPELHRSREKASLIKSTTISTSCVILAANH
uniref:Uncharacterized protein n=1 Tax=Anguilla anguilla TaxID=7936 RepID=A0A0E9TTU6_ANGAN